jgi:uroporphyrin-III C-methyltransferase/precorrin-2 dehydrogenase/sirohydrochlorin ferrochelatase
MKARSKKPCDGLLHTGRVTLVGAGPGDPELLTLKAVKAMQEADVILFDALVSEEILSFARATAKRMLVGKRGHRPSCRQDDINALMLKLAHQGKHVVRLKCGDPGLFGRGGEEIAHLQAAGIPVTVVPGITSASAMAASLNASLTHRDHAQSVRFVTGHGKHVAMPEEIDWTGLADPATTLVIYMGGRTGPAIAHRLIAEGLPAATPCVVATSVSRPEATHRFGTLGDLATGALKTVSDAPVLIGIGEVFASAVERTLEVWPTAACQ